LKTIWPSKNGVFTQTPLKFLKKNFIHRLCSLKNTRIFLSYRKCSNSNQRNGSRRQTRCDIPILLRIKKTESTTVEDWCPWRKSSDFNRSDFYGSPTTIQIIQRTPNPPSTLQLETEKKVIETLCTKNTGKNSQFIQKFTFENPNSHKIHIFKISFWTKFRFSKSYFSQNSQFQNLIFHKIHISKIPYLTKFTFKSNPIFHKIHIFQESNSMEFLY